MCFQTWEGREEQFNRRSSNKSSLDFPPLIEKQNESGAAAAAVRTYRCRCGFDRKLERVGELETNAKIRQRTPVVHKAASKTTYSVCTKGVYLI